MEFRGKVAMVSGAAAGIGRATALHLARAGATLCLLDIDAAGLAATEADVAALGNAVMAQRTDVSNPAACAEVVELAVQRFGRLDVLCNIAGIARASHFTDVTVAQWRLMTGVNLDGVFFLSQAAMPHLLASKGNIVNMSSSAGLVGQAYNSVYCATKGAVVSLTKALAVEYAKRGVRVNAVCPGAVKTSIMATFRFPDGADASLMAPLMPKLAAAEPEEIAEVIAFLASDKARYITGIAMPVDGGQVAG